MKQKRELVCTFSTLSGLLLLGASASCGAAEKGFATLVNSTADPGTGTCEVTECTLREAIAAASPNDVITFAPLFNTARTITLSGSELNIAKNLTITGPGARLLTISANNASRVFAVTPGVSVGISGVTVTHGRSPNNSAGGGITNSGNLTVSNCIISDNVASGTGAGGGIHLEQGTLTVNNCAIHGNHSNGGGGISASGGTVNINGSSLSNNTANFDGGGANLQNTNATLINTTFSNNSAGSGGGGLSHASFGGSFTLAVSNSTFALNRGISSGGLALFATGANGVLAGTLRNTLFANNSAPNLRSSGSASITSSGFNLSSDNGNGFLSATGDRVNAVAGLGPLSIQGVSLPGMHCCPIARHSMPARHRLESPSINVGGLASSIPRESLIPPMALISVR